MQNTSYIIHRFCHTNLVTQNRKHKEEKTMADISILDLQNLRHLIGGYETTHCKMTDYARQAQDEQVKQLFQDAADSAMKNKQDLMKFL